MATTGLAVFDRTVQKTNEWLDERERQLLENRRERRAQPKDAPQEKPGKPRKPGKPPQPEVRP